MASGMDPGERHERRRRGPGVGPPSISGRSRAALSARAGDSPVWAVPVRGGASSSARGRSVAANRKTQTDCQEHVAHRRDVPDHRERDRDDVAEGSEVEQEIGVELAAG